MDPSIPTPPQSTGPQPAASAPVPTSAPICPQCHQPVQPEFYYCPNCGKRLAEPPLATDLAAQALLYGFSIVLPFIAYLAIGYWQGIKYARSPDPRARSIGWIAIALIVISSIYTFWLAAVWINSAITQATSSIGNLGGF